MKWVKKVLDLVYPPRCPLCRKLTPAEEIVCFSCLQDILQEMEGCFLCFHPVFQEDRGNGWIDREFYLDSIYGLGLYRGNLKELIHKYKYESRRELADFFAPILAGGVESCINSGKWIGPEGVVPVPLHPLRLKERGFNQAQLLGTELAHRLNLPLYDVLTRTRNTQTQTRLSRDKRFSNIKGAFNLKKEVNKLPASLIIVDDICTSGATLNEGARILRKHGVKKVYGAVLCR